MSEEKLIYMDTKDTEARLEEAMPVLSAPESLSAANVASALAGRKKSAGRVPARKYVTAAVAAVLVMAIGAAGAALSRVSGLFASKKAEDVDTDGRGGYEYEATAPSVSDDDIRNSGGYDSSPVPGAESFMIIIDGKEYEGYWEDAVEYDEVNAETYLGEKITFTMTSGITGKGINKSGEPDPAGGMYYRMNATADRGVICLVTESPEGETVILFLHPSEG